MLPRLYSISTCCLLKHYNQDYILHSLRTDFTGSNGVGKSIIADLFQIVFVADSRYIKFATEGIDKKGRKIEKLPYESGIGYVFFNVEVAEGNFISIGAAILSQGNNLVKPFIITSSIDLEKEKLDKHTFTADKLLFNSNFLKPSGEPYVLDELARVFPEKHNLYIHYFGSREEKGTYYNWLYRNELLSINLVKEGNLKAFAKVIQSFSKSKSLDIDSSKSLIEYLFEEDEIEINQEYSQQEQVIRKLLFQFKTTKEQINDISHKQDDLRRLRNYDAERRRAAHELAFTLFLVSYRNNIKKQNEFDKLDRELRSKKIKIASLAGRSEKFLKLVGQADRDAKKEQQIFTDLAGKQSLFDKLENMKEEEQMLRGFDTEGLMQEASMRSSELLVKDARFYEENIQNSRGVLRRYVSIISMERKKKDQDEWLRDKIRKLENQEMQLANFLKGLQEAEQNNLFANALSTNKTLTKAQQATLVHLRTVLLSKPEVATEGMRYTESANLIKDLWITEDNTNNGWWIKTGPLHEFVPETSLLLPDLSKMEFENIRQLKEYLSNQGEELKRRKEVYDNLQNGVLPEDFIEYEFDIDLSDATKISGHRLAAELCALINYKIADLDRQKFKETEELQKVKQQYGIAVEGLEYHALLDKIKMRSDHLRGRYEMLGKRYKTEELEINTINANLPFLNENSERLSRELVDTQKKLVEAQKHYQDKYPEKPLPDLETDPSSLADIADLEAVCNDAEVKYLNIYNQTVGKYEETKGSRDIRVNEQINNRNFSFDILEQALLGTKIRTLDEVTGYLEALNSELLSITDDLLGSLVKVFGKTEGYFDRYRELVQSLNDFFRGKLISERFYFRIDFNPAPKLDIKWIEYLRKSAPGIAAGGVASELTPEQFIESIYMKFSGNKSNVSIDDLLNPKRYFLLKGKLTDENNREIPGSTGESYTAVALLGIARLSVVQDGARPGLRFIILEESATLDNVNFGMFPVIAKKYGYQIITMTPKPYAIGDDGGWFIHQLIPGKENRDVNYPKVMSYFRTNKSQIELSSYLKARG